MYLIEMLLNLFKKTQAPAIYLFTNNLLKT